MKLLNVYKSAPHYRASIYRLISQNYDCDFIFGQGIDGIKQMDTTLLRGNVTITRNKYVLGKWYYQKGVIKKLFAPYDRYLMLIESRCLSTWAVALLSRLMPGKKVYGWSHGVYGKESKKEMLIKKALFRLLDGCFVYGNHARELMIQSGLDGDRIFTIHNSLDHATQMSIRERIRPSDVFSGHFQNDFPTLLFIGRLTPVKRLDLLIEAVSALKKEDYPCNLCLVGDGKERERLERKVQELDIVKNVWFFGECYDEEQNASLIYNADVCVAPGNVGLTAMHTMMFGTPVISHDDFGHQMPEFEAIIPGKTGAFYKYLDLASLTSVIKEWLETHKDREAVRQDCFREIDTQWTPEFQIGVLRKHLK